VKCKYLENQVYIGTDGSYRLCCVSMEPANKENIKTHTPEEWKNSKTNIEAKEKLARGEWPDACVKCKFQEERGVESKRTKARFYGPGLSHLDLRFGNSCNLKCISCWNMSSSSIAIEEVEMAKAGIPVHNILEIPNFNWVSDETLKKLEILPIQEVYLTGGEPMMVKHLPQFLERLDPSTHLRFNTNGTIWNPKIEKLLKKFNVVSMTLSLDAVDKKIEYIRYGSIWEKIEYNAKKYSDFCFVSISPTISVLNAWFYDEIKEYAKNQNWPLYENLLMHPEWLHCKNAPEKLKNKYQGIKIDWYKDAAEIEQINQFKAQIQKLDQWRKISIKEYLPVVAEAYGIN
jgi:organic radical activating enzyme